MFRQQIERVRNDNLVVRTALEAEMEACVIHSHGSRVSSASGGDGSGKGATGGES